MNRLIKPTLFVALCLTLAVPALGDTADDYGSSGNAKFRKADYDGAIADYEDTNNAERLSVDTDSRP